MPRSTATKQFNTFVKGIVTEVNPLTFPENASLDEDNFVLKRNGSRERRLGVDYETNYVLTNTSLPLPTITGTRQSFHVWQNPSGNTSVSIGVIRVANKLWFVDLLAEAPSANLLNSGVPVTISGLANAEIETAVINNSLIIVSSDLPKPISLTYTSSDQVLQEEVDIKVRDIWGVWDLVGFIPSTVTSFIDWRRDTIDPTHRYNLQNQGWSDKIETVCGALWTAIDCTFSKLAVYPSNADIWTLGKVGDASSANFEKYDPESMKKNSIDNSEAPKGSYIIDAFNRGSSRSLVSGLTLYFTDRERGSFTTIASYAGRVFYSGISSDVDSPDDRSPNYSNYIFFSQVVTAQDKLGKCYQDADPTSPNISDIVDTDGGCIQIPEATNIIKIVSTKTSLLVFAKNGVWEVFGDTQGFVATSYQVSKVSNNGCTSPKSIVDVGSAIIAWTKAGIYAYVMDPASGRYSSESISITSIQTLYNSFSEITKNNARGLYDEKENTVRWLINTLPNYSNTNYPNKYNKELILDLTLQAFYVHTVDPTTGPFIADYIDIPNYAIQNYDEEVYTTSDGAVLVTSGDTVVVSIDEIKGRVSQFAFLTIEGSSFTISKYTNRYFKDWEAHHGAGNGIDYLSYLLTGYDTSGDILRHKQVPYIWFYFTKTEDGFTTVGDSLEADNQSGCLVQTQWNWTNSAVAGKWGTEFQAYRLKRNYIPSGAGDSFDTGENVVVTKSTLRGNGRAISLLIKSESGKDMKLLGWANITSAEGMP